MLGSISKSDSKLQPPGTGSGWKTESHSTKNTSEWQAGREQGLGCFCGAPGLPRPCPGLLPPQTDHCCRCLFVLTGTCPCNQCPRHLVMIPSLCSQVWQDHLSRSRSAGRPCSGQVLQLWCAGARYTHFAPSAGGRPGLGWCLFSMYQAGVSVWWEKRMRGKGWVSTTALQS